MERDKLRQEAVSLDEDPAMKKTLEEKEVSFYKKQCEIFSIDYEILDKNESMFRLDLKRSKEINDNDMTMKERQKLEQCLANVARKKALLRNKMVSLSIMSVTQFVLYRPDQSPLHTRISEPRIFRFRLNGFL